MINYFLDCEFIEDGKTIDLISIGLVSSDGREFYAINCECDYSKASNWVLENVLKPMGLDKDGFTTINKTMDALHKQGREDLLEPLINTVIHGANKNREVIKEELLRFIFKCENKYLRYEDLITLLINDSLKPQFWGEWCSYDWVCFCQIFGTMMDLPSGLPMMCNDVIQYADMFGISPDELPESLETPGNHSAILGARTVKLRYDYLTLKHPLSSHK